jgi:hypothetical protein
LILEKFGLWLYIFLSSYQLVMNFRRLIHYLKKKKGGIIPRLTRGILRFAEAAGSMTGGSGSMIIDDQARLGLGGPG